MSNQEMLVHRHSIWVTGLNKHSRQLKTSVAHDSLALNKYSSQVIRFYQVLLASGYLLMSLLNYALEKLSPVQES